MLVLHRYQANMGWVRTNGPVLFTCKDSTTGPVSPVSTRTQGKGYSGASRELSTGRGASRKAKPPKGAGAV